MLLEEIYKRIKSQHDCYLEIDDFSSVLMMYPAALVAAADGEFSDLERLNIVKALKEASSEDDFKLCEMYLLLNHLMTLKEEEKNNLLAQMKEVISGKDEIKSIVLDLMISTADSDDGISEVEQNVINNLKSILSL